MSIYTYIYTYGNIYMCMSETKLYFIMKKNGSVRNYKYLTRGRAGWNCWRFIHKSLILSWIRKHYCLNNNQSIWFTIPKFIKKNGILQHYFEMAWFTKPFQSNAVIFCFFFWSLFDLNNGHYFGQLKK